jgi:hypothetical protein
MNKKVAICLKGAISKIDTKFWKINDIYCNNPYVNFIACYNSIKRHIIDSNPNYDIDFFIHCWNTDLENDLCNLYKPKKYYFEDNLQYSEMFMKKVKNNQKEYSQISCAYSQKCCINLMKEYSDDNNINYDIVMIYRPDCILFTNIYFDNYNIKNNNIIVNGLNDCNCDVHFIMNYNNSLKFSYLYDAAGDEIVASMHSWIKKFVITKLNLCMYNDNIIPGSQQEAIRKIYNYSYKPGYISLNQLISYGLTEEEIKLYNCTR